MTHLNIHVLLWVGSLQDFHRHIDITATSMIRFFSYCTALESDQYRKRYAPSVTMPTQNKYTTHAYLT